MPEYMPRLIVMKEIKSVVNSKAKPVNIFQEDGKLKQCVRCRNTSFMMVTEGIVQCEGCLKYFALNAGEYLD